LSSVFDEIIQGIPKQKAVASPEHGEYSLPSTSSSICYSNPVPFSTEYKANIDPAKGIIESYLTVWNHTATGERYVDSYLDTVEPGSFKNTISNLNQERRHRGDNALAPFLWQHDRKELLGSVVNLEEQSKGVVYTAQLNMKVQRAREAFALAEEKQIGSSYGYDPIRYQYSTDTKGNEIRHLLEIKLHESSLVSHPANPYAVILGTKDKKRINSRIEELASKMNTSFDDLERLLKGMTTAWPNLDAAPFIDSQSEVDQDISALLREIQRQMR
jgi:HK97 family phage prohead protease